MRPSTLISTSLWHMTRNLHVPKSTGHHWSRYWQPLLPQRDHLMKEQKQAVYTLQEWWVIEFNVHSCTMSIFYNAMTHRWPSAIWPSRLAKNWPTAVPALPIQTVATNAPWAPCEWLSKMKMLPSGVRAMPTVIGVCTNTAATRRLSWWATVKSRCSLSASTR